MHAQLMDESLCIHTNSNYLPLKQIVTSCWLPCILCYGCGTHDVYRASVTDKHKTSTVNHGTVESLLGLQTWLQGRSVTLALERAGPLSGMVPKLAVNGSNPSGDNTTSMSAGASLSLCGGQMSQTSTRQALSVTDWPEFGAPKGLLSTGSP